MWFKNLNIYQIIGDMPEESVILKGLEKSEFRDEGPAGPVKTGFFAPAASHDNLLHSVMGCHMFCIKEETRKVPGDVLREEVEKEIKKRKARGDEISGKDKREIKEDVTNRLFPKVMPKVKKVWAYIDKDRKWLVLDEASRKKGEDWATFIRKNLDIQILPLQSMEVPGRKMNLWLSTKQFPEDLSSGTKCKLFMRNDTSNKVSYTGHEVSEDESIQSYLDAGYEVSELEMRHWISGDPVTYVLTEDLLVKSVIYSQYMVSDVADQSEDADSQSDAIFVAVCGAARDIYDKLMLALGGAESSGD
jgi:DNA recombination-dependent growth factor C